MGNEQTKPTARLSIDTSQLIPYQQQFSSDSSEVGSRAGSNQNLYLVQPTSSYESFQRYIAHLNRLIRQNGPFLKAKFGITTLQLSCVLTDSAFIPSNLKKKLFDSRVAKTAVLVQYTRTRDAETPIGEDTDLVEDYVFIRKFRSVQEFIERVRTLDTVLENIESFSADVRRINGRSSGFVTPDTSPALIIEEMEEDSASQSLSVQKFHSATQEPQILIEEADNSSEVAQEFPWEAGEETSRPANSDINTCVICMARHIDCVLSCFHAYCRPCIDDWKQRDPTCPLCREMENGRGSFDMLRGPDSQLKEQIKQDLMKELARLIDELLDEGQALAKEDANTLMSFSPEKTGSF